MQDYLGGDRFPLFTVGKNSRGAAFLVFKEENRYAACSSTVFAKPAILEVNLGLI